jgi:hypothetical protein
MQPGGINMDFTDFSTASDLERRKVQVLIDSLSKKGVEHPVGIEFYQDGEVIPAKIVKQYDQGVIKFFLISQTEMVKAGYIQALWEKELFKWSWGSKELGINP